VGAVVRGDRPEPERRLEAGCTELCDHARPRGLDVGERVGGYRHRVAGALRISRREMRLGLFGVRNRLLRLCDELVELGGDVLVRDGIPFVRCNRTLRRDHGGFKHAPGEIGDLVAELGGWCSNSRGVPPLGGTLVVGGVLK